MALRYDFDMGTVTPDGLPDAFGNLEMTGVGGERRAMFRDPETVAALRKADQAVQVFFIESGFALQTHDSGAPPDRFLQRDEAARLAVIEQLTNNLATHQLEGADWGGFAFPDFMAALSRARVLDDDKLVAPAFDGHTPNAELYAAHQASQRIRRRRTLAMTGLVLGLVLLLIVATQLLA